MSCVGLPEETCVAQPQCIYTRRTSKRRPHCRKSVFKVAAEMRRRGMDLRPVRRSNGRKSMKIRTRSSLRAKRRADKKKLLQLFNEMGVKSPQLSSVEISEAESPFGRREVIHEYVEMQRVPVHRRKHHRRHRRSRSRSRSRPVSITQPYPAAVIIR